MSDITKTYEFQSLNLITILLIVFIQIELTLASLQGFAYEWDSRNSFSIQDVKFSKIKPCLNHDLIAFSKQNQSIYFLANINGALKIVSQYNHQFTIEFAVSNDCSLIVAIQNNSLTIFEVSVNNYKMTEIINSDLAMQYVNDIRFSCDNNFLFFTNIQGQIQVNQIDKQNKIINTMNIIFTKQSYQYLTGISIRCLNSFPQYGVIATMNNKIRIVNFRRLYPFNEKLEVSDIAYFEDEDVLDQIKITNNGKLVIAVNVAKGIRIGSLNQIYLFQQGQNPLKLQFQENSFWFQGTDIPKLISISISSNNNYLFVSARSYGIQIIDITELDNPKLYQTLQLNYASYPLVVSLNDEYIYVLSSNFISIINKKPIISDDDYPNLFNIHLVHKGFLDEQQSKKQRCYISQDNTHFWGSYQRNGLFQFTLDKELPQFLIQKQTSIQNQPYSYINNILFDNTEQFLFLPVANQGNILEIYDISNIDSPNLISSVQSNINLSIDSMVFNSQKTIIAASLGQSILFIDISDLYKVTILAFIDLKDYINQQCSGLMFAQNDKYLLASSRGQGLVLIDVQDINKISVLSVMTTYGGEDIQSFSSTYNFAYYIDGFAGVKILQLTNLPDIKIISRIEIKGWSNHALPIGNDEFLIVSTLDKGMITLFDIRDKNRPIFISQLQFDLFNSYSTCFASNSHTIFINSQNYILVYPIKTQFKIHKQISFLNESQQKMDYLNEVNKAITFQVGQKVKIKLNFIFPLYDISIKNLHYYEENAITEIPNWITFLKKEQSIMINVVKEGLQQKQSESRLNVLILETFQILTKSDFKFQSDLVIDQNMSEQIYLLLKNYNIIDKNNQVDFSDLSVHFHEVKADIYSLQQFSNVTNKQKLIIFIQDVLKRSKQYNPIYFYLKGSLTFNIKDSQKIISSYSEVATVKVAIDQKEGSFYIRDTQELAISYEKEKSIIKLQGKVQLLNQALVGKQIIFIPSNSQSKQTIDFSKIKISIEVLDDLNYKMNIMSNLEEAMFIKQIEPIQITNSIQDQFDSMFTNSYIQVDKYLTFSFKKELFNDPQGFSLSFSAKYQLDDSQEQPIASTGWLQFVYEESGMRVQGLVPESVFWDDIKITIIASNGYEETSDFFVMKVRIISIGLLLKFLLQITSPIAGIYTMYQYRSIPYNIYYKNKHYYQKETIETNKEYIKKIPILNYDFIISKKIYKAYKKYIQDNYEKEMEKMRGSLQEEKEKVKRTSLDKRFNCNISENIKGNNQQNLQAKELNDIQHTTNLQTIPRQDLTLDINIDITQQKFIELDKSPTKQQEMLSYRKISSPSKKMKTLSSESEDDIEEEEKQKGDNKNKQSGALRRSIRLNTYQKQSYLNQQRNKVNRIIQFISKNVNEAEQERTQFQDYIMSFFLNKKGVILIKLLFKDILSKNLTFKHKKKIYHTLKYKEELENSNSALYYSLKSFFVRFLLQKDKKARAVYRFLKNQCIESQQYTDRDWYKHLIEIKPTKETDIHGQNIPFPRLKIRESQLQKNLNELTIGLKTPRVYNKENNYSINLYLVIEVLFADALGLYPKNIDSYEPVFGESIHCSQFKIKQIEALIQIKHSHCLKFRHLLNQDFRAYGSSQNCLLPNWMNINQKKNSIIINGVPKIQDVEEIMIRIYDIYDFITMQFKLEIVNSEEDQKQQIQLLKHSNITFKNSQQKIKSDSSKRQFFFENRHNSNINSSLRSDDQNPIEMAKLSFFNMKDQGNSSLSKGDRQSTSDNIIQDDINEENPHSNKNVKHIPQFIHFDSSIIDFKNKRKRVNSAYSKQSISDQL